MTDPHVDTHLRWGILAPGGIAEDFAGDLVSNGRQLTAVASRSLDRAASFAQRYDIPTALGTYAELARREDVDVVYIASPHAFHAEHAIMMLEGGKHVLIEKPLALNAAQVRRVHATAQQHGRFVMEAMRTRFMPHTRRMHELIAAGALGDVRFLLSDHFQSLDSTPEGRLWNPELGGGALLDLGIYNLSFTVDFLGLPSEINALARMTPTGVDVETAVQMTHPDGAHSTFGTGMAARGSNRAILIGTAGRFEVAGRFYDSGRMRLIDTSDRVVEDFDAQFDHHGKLFEIEEVERCLVAGLTESPRMTMAESADIHAAMDEIRSQIGLRYPGDAPPTQLTR
ncbi:Gfo/Idh/MocA family protein [Pseudactinotalea sp. HY158]|uniref:Gfo/Idh/MocA family protein n=1 Tax=Pseudactinotalea sp. HY158 TaxID=2654547 RepID=UPI00189217BE|nr:Gfo/Idh/MocA family oxidoreductase [Pseudactinotalea sp. HY158]